MTQSEFSAILENEIRPFVSDIISNAPLHNDKMKYVKDSWEKLHAKLTLYSFPDDTFRELNVRYRKKIQAEILR